MARCEGISSCWNLKEHEYRGRTDKNGKMILPSNCEYQKRTDMLFWKTNGKVSPHFKDFHISKIEISLLLLALRMLHKQYDLSRKTQLEQLIYNLTYATELNGKLVLP